MDEFGRRQFRAAILGALEVSHSVLPAPPGPSPQTRVPAKQNEAGRAQVASQDKLSLSRHKAQRGTNRACHARAAEQDESSVLQQLFPGVYETLGTKRPFISRKHEVFCETKPYQPPRKRLFPQRCPRLSNPGFPVFDIAVEEEAVDDKFASWDGGTEWTFGGC